MKCEDFENQADDFVAGHLPPSADAAAAAHAAGCAACGALVIAMRANFELLALPDETPDLTDAVLAVTSGPSCERAQSLLCDFVDGELDAVSSALVRDHREHCARCDALASTLAWLGDVLPDFTERAPDAEFTADVVQVTSALHVHRSPWRARLRDGWRSLMLRPRLAWEVAYVGTLIIVLLFGTPGSPLHSVPTRAVAAVEVSPVDALRNMGRQLVYLHRAIDALGARAWGVTGGRAVDHLETWAGDYARQHPGMPEAAASLQRNSGALRSALGQGNVAQAGLAAGAARADIDALWKSFRAGTPPAP